ncbi:adenosylcobinamide-GDP ribazoletransferase [Dysgonomonas massiliensis]|uniref:adenosylcobinamide-GDP ribazoletransferase n=1 Tax=Dysgonomonas massiliensis TaxID=2040292 RepID=UPI000C7853DF|nr:adenosylcobinamide-GDP ribazoletransferase [Dysgonomonas massiliensis]
MKNIAAALVFFTRLPFWRLKAFQVAPEYFSQVINYWAVAGWLTGGVMAACLWLSSQVLPYSAAIIIALLIRILITGALHEDGLADFFDGFGGGNTKERILAIMKDSHIGTYGVISLIFYFLLLYSLLSQLSLQWACLSILMADPLCKYISSLMTRFLIYARTAETSKSGTVYQNMSFKALFLSSFFGLLPLLLAPDLKWLLAVIFPILTFSGLVMLMKRKIQGYTGDCCGAMFLLCELSLYLGIVIVYQNLVL